MGTERLQGPDDWAMTRRTALRAGALGLGGVLIAGEGLAGAAMSGASATPKRGGRLRVGHVGAGKGESFNPGRGSSFIDASRYYNLYDPLVRVNPDFSQSPGLALEWKANATATKYEIKLRPGVKWHDGSPFTADDVIWSLRQMGDAKHVGHAAVANIKLAQVKKLGPLVVQVPLKSPDARLSDSFVQQNTVMTKNGYKNFAKPIGTGPFKFKSFEIGVRSLCVRNPDYWENGKPYVDEWEDISIDDNSARLNALLGGQIDMMSQLDFAQAKAQKSKKKIQVIDAPSPAYQVFIMRTDRPPFDDVNVRQAFRLVVDRQALINVALGGFGTPGNDLFGYGLPYYAKSLAVRKPDIEQAKSLLKKAGKSNLAVTLQTSDIVPGFTQAATLLAQQAQQAGIKVTIKKEPANAYFDTSLLYTKMDFAQSYWTTGSLAAWYSQSLASDAVWNETHFKEPAFDKMVRQAIGARTVDEATALWLKVQKVQYERGGYIGWANQNIVDAASNKVKGMKASAFFNLGGFNYRDVWLGA
ncbi:MAG: peptide/nickel transport system substrate-binding protein [Gaiellales bacterium]|nr:peptide/nickel transport system substrate-binding protein [Gaiellales bacterium]MDX6597780.1 peptide/nickel transport system substrate-binding protein [Gaiellales bacterium]